MGANFNASQVISTGSAAPLSASSEMDLLLSMIAAKRNEFDRDGFISRDVIAQMKRAGIFRSSTPKCFGGDALAPHLFLSLVERIGEVDGSAGWVAAFGSSGTYLAALPRETQAKIYATGPDQVFAGGFYPLQRAVRSEGGWTVSGRWKFASGCKGADWIGVGIDVAKGEAGPPVGAMAVCPAEEVEIIDNWDAFGMEGTGSHDTRVEAKFYADEWLFLRGTQGVIDEPLYKYPALAYQAEVHAAVNLGLARAALNLAAEMSCGAKIMPGAPRLADRAYFRTNLAQAEAKLRSARLFFYDSSQTAWERLLADGEIGIDSINLLRLSATHAAHTAAEVVQQLFRIVGMAAIHHTHRMQKILRDVMVVTQHAALSEATLESAGAIFAGMKPPAGYP